MSAPEIISILTPEQELARRYMELGVQIKNLSDEREALKNTELWPLIESGVSVDIRDQILRPEYQRRIDFDWEQAIADGHLSAEQASRYMRVKITRVLQFRKRGDVAEELAYDAYLEAGNKAYEQYKVDRDEARKKKQNEVIR